MLCALDLYSDVCHCFSINLGKKLKEVFQDYRLDVVCVCCGGCLPSVL